MACLTPEELLRLRATPVEQVEPEIAAHLASCESCQRLLLFGAQREARPPKQPPSLRDAFIRVGIVLVAVGMVLASIFMLVRR